MKSLSFIVLFFVCATTYGKIWIVDSNPGTTSRDFTNLQAAHDGASAGDTLYLIGSPVNYITTKVTVTKRLVIIGPGYFLSENPDTQASVTSAFIDNTTAGVCEELEFAIGSEGSVLMGIEILGRLVISANNVLIKRNHIRQEPSCALGMVAINASNVFFLQNYVDGSLNNGIPLVNVGASQSGVAIGNNYLFHSCYGCGGGVLALNSASSSSLLIYNNIIHGGINVSNATVQNNFFNTDNQFTATASVVRNNIHTNGYLPGGNGNINSSPLGLRFIDTGSTDGRWKLKATSPGLGAGFGGVDCGIYGGPEPYVLSGIPPIPSIYLFNAPAIGEKNTGLPIQVKVKSNN